MNINGYTGKADLEPAMEYSVQVLKKYVAASDLVVKIVE
jgi:hypothetical protein